MVPDYDIMERRHQKNVYRLLAQPSLRACSQADYSLNTQAVLIQ